MNPDGRSRRIFVAGSSGATGRTVMRLGSAAGFDLVPHVRPQSASRAPKGAAILDLADERTLTDVLRSCTTVMQLIGTMRNRFARGDTYLTSDIGTTADLVAGARTAGVDHFVLLSSVGAGRPIGAYLNAKAKAEQIVRESGIPYTIVRPSTFVGEGHKPPPGFGALTHLFGLKSYQPIAIEDLGRLLLWIARQRGPLGAVLEAGTLWDGVAHARAAISVPEAPVT